jgi:hypothetical protein
MEQGVMIAPLMHHELHDSDGQIDLWHLTKHTIGTARSLVAYGDRDLEGVWSTYTVFPSETIKHADRFSAWLHLYRHAQDPERQIRPPQSHAEPLTEQQG